MWQIIDSKYLFMTTNILMEIILVIIWLAVISLLHHSTIYVLLITGDTHMFGLIQNDTIIFTPTLLQSLEGTCTV